MGQVEPTGIYVIRALTMTRTTLRTETNALYLSSNCVHLHIDVDIHSFIGTANLSLNQALRLISVCCAAYHDVCRPHLPYRVLLLLRSWRSCLPKAQQMLHPI